MQIYRGIARRLLAAGYVNLRRPNQRNMRNFGFEFYSSIAWVPLSKERENVLPTEMLVQLVQIGSEGHRVGSPQPKQFTSRSLGFPSPAAKSSVLLAFGNDRFMRFS